MPVRIKSGGGSGGGYALQSVSNAVFDFGNGQVTIKWTDPENTVIGGVTVAEWAGTVVVRNTDHYPENVKDGVLVVDSKVKNQYQANGFVDTVENDVAYYYSIFAYSKKVYAIPVRESGTPKAVSRVIAENSWDVISAIAESGQASKYWNVGDEINVDFGSYGTYTFQIYDFNHDDKSDGTGKAGITFGMKNLTNLDHYLSGNYSGSWESSDMRKTTLPLYWNTMQSDVKAVVKTVNKKTASSGSSNSSLQTTKDNLFIFACKEVGFDSSVNTEDNALSAYPIFTDNNSRIKKTDNGKGSIDGWWLRTPISNVSLGRFVDTNGCDNAVGFVNKMKICFGFCV